MLDKLAGNTTPTLVALIDWDTMKTRNGGTDVRNINNTSTGIKAYGGDSSFPTTSGGSDSRKGTIMLKESYTLYDKILVVSSSDSGNIAKYTIFNVWELQKALSEGYRFYLSDDDADYWVIFQGCNLEQLLTLFLPILFGIPKFKTALSLKFMALSIEVVK